MVHPAIQSVTERIIERSKKTRKRYITRMQRAARDGVARGVLSCGNLAHGFAACNQHEKDVLRAVDQPNIAIISAYNDMLSAHQPYQYYPAIIKKAVEEMDAVAQFAGGVPAMCDGVTQGQPGMELSLFSRDVIAMATAVSLSHNMFDAALCLGICDKIVPGLLIGALSFGHLPVIFVPGGPMPTGTTNDEKKRVRQLYAEGKASRDDLLEIEAKSYHAPGTCTFYGTANSNQMLMEIMGLQLPGSSFVAPNAPLRNALTRAAAQQAVALTARRGNYLPLYEVLDERAIVNGIVGLLATGGSTNHTIHLVAIARAAGILIDWDDFSELSDVVPLLTRIYPNGSADVNDFQNAGGMSFLIRELLLGGLLHEDVTTITGEGLSSYVEAPELDGEDAVWSPGAKESTDKTVLASLAQPFSKEGGLKLLSGNLGRAVIKTSAVKPEHCVIEAPARVFPSQQALINAFKKGELHGDFVAVLTWQGPQAIGMPELHQLTPTLGVLQDMGFKVALVTDGRMSGASGKVPAAIHVSPECAAGGLLAKVKDGDMIVLDAHRGVLEVKVTQKALRARKGSRPDISAHQEGMGRELFSAMRGIVTSAEEGASFVLTGGEE